MIQMKLMVKEPPLIFGITTAWGFALLTFFFVVSYLGRTYSAEILTIEALIPLNNIFGYFWVPILVVGTVFLTVGILGIGKQRMKNKRKLFSVLTVAFTPIIVCALFFSLILATTYPALSDPPERMAVNNVSVTNTNPLILSLNAKSFYMAEIWFDQAYVKNCNQSNVASIVG